MLHVVVIFENNMKYNNTKIQKERYEGEINFAQLQGGVAPTFKNFLGCTCVSANA